MIKRFPVILLAALAVCGASNAHAAFVLNALTSFGGGDGWLAPAESTFLQGASVQRGLAYNGTTNQLILADRNTGTFLRVLNGNTGALVNNLLTTDGATPTPMPIVTGGTFNINKVDVGDDGAIYAGNLVTSATADFKIYRWADSNPTTVPTIAYQGETGYARIGDTFAVTGSGGNTRIVASGTGSSGVAVYSTFDGESFTQAPAAATTNTPAGGFRLGLDFIDADTVIGKQEGTTFYTADLQVDLSTIGTPFANSALDTNERPLAFYAPNNLLATIHTIDNTVRLYDASNLSSLTLLSAVNLTVGTVPVANGNSAGQLSFGNGPDGLRLYALNTNNGIQAFRVSAVPEPGSILLAALVGVGVVARRRIFAKRKMLVA